MQITPISVNTNFTSASPKKQESFEELCKKEGIELPKLTPLQHGLSTTAVWFGLGLGIDRALGAMFKIFKQPLKQSLVLNGVIALTFGVFDYFKTKNREKNEKIQEVSQ